MTIPTPKDYLAAIGLIVFASCVFAIAYLGG